MSFLDKILHRNKEELEEPRDEFDFGEEHRNDNDEEFSTSGLNMHQDIGQHFPQQEFKPNQGDDLLMSRLETINVKLDNILHRLEKLEKIAERESGNDKW